MIDRLRLHAAVAILLGLWIVSPLTAGAIVNGGFETGDFSGWNLVQPGFANVVTSAPVLGGTPGSKWLPTSGQFFALLQGGSAANRYTLMSQTISASAGDVLTFKAFFNAGDLMPFNDNAFANILNLKNFNLDNLYFKDVSSVGPMGKDGWTTVQYTFPVTGQYSLIFGINNELDNNRPSYLGVDDVEIGPRGSGQPTPEPASNLVWGLAGLSMAAVVRRRTSA
jgi:MYXO-CTERM domain-containing protein